MVSVSVRPSRAASHVADGDIVLESGRQLVGTVLLADISGVKWTRQKLQRLANAAQAKMDLGPRGTGIRLIADLEDIDPDKGVGLTPAEHAAALLAKYGGRMFIHDDGISLVSRSDVISFTLVDGDLHPLVSVVR